MSGLVRVTEHVGHRWKRDDSGVYCTCTPKQRIRLYAHGTCYNSPRLQRQLAEPLDRIREEIGLLGAMNSRS